MSPLPSSNPDTALFLDFDGTLADLAPRPELVQVEPELVGTLRRCIPSLTARSRSSRAGPWPSSTTSCNRCAPSAGVPGAEFRHGGERVITPPAPGIGALMPQLEALVNRHPGLRLERNRSPWPSTSGRPRNSSCWCEAAVARRTARRGRAGGAARQRWSSRSSRPAWTRARPSRLVHAHAAVRGPPAAVRGRRRSHGRSRLRGGAGARKRHRRAGRPARHRRQGGAAQPAGRAAVLAASVGARADGQYGATGRSSSRRGTHSPHRL